MRRRTLLAVLVTTFFLLTAAAAFAVEWAGNGYYLASGPNGFLNHTVHIYLSEGLGENRAVCAGIRGYGDTCVGRGSVASYSYKATVVESEPYLHNHDTEAGYFHGWWYE